jgi:hypothetical protein
MVEGFFQCQLAEAEWRGSPLPAPCAGVWKLVCPCGELQKPVIRFPGRFDRSYGGTRPASFFVIDRKDLHRAIKAGDNRTTQPERPSGAARFGEISPQLPKGLLAVRRPYARDTNNGSSMREQIL